MLQMISKTGLNPSSTIGEFLDSSNNHVTLDKVIPSELERIELLGGSSQGWRLLGKNADKYGEVGVNAVDLSESVVNGDYGAIGENSFAAGMGVIARNLGSTALGRFNIASDLADTILEVGVGLDVSHPANGLEVYRDGSIVAPLAENNVIDARGLRTLVTKQYTDDKYLQLVEKGANNGLATLDFEGKVPVDQLPPISITSTYVVASLAEQLSLTVQEGDVCVRSDTNENWIAKNSNNGSLLDWTKLLTPTDSVLSVNGKTGVVTLSTDDIEEGSNPLKVYYTEARFNDSFANKTTDDLTEGINNKYYTEQRVDDNFANKTTDDLTEGITNRYYTVQRVMDEVIAQISTDNIAEGAINLYYTDQRVADTINNDLNTDDLSEGAVNWYYTDTRFEDSWNNRTTDDLVEGPHRLYYTEQRATANFNMNFANATTNGLSEGTNNLYYTEARDNANFDNNFRNNYTTSDLTEGTNLYYTEARDNSNFDNNIRNNYNTDALSEGLTNLYYTEVRDNANFLMNIHDNVDTDDLSEGAHNLYYTDNRVITVFNAQFLMKTTDDLSEGSTNLYYTTARVNDAFDARLLLKDTDDLTEGDNNLYFTNARVGNYIGTITTDSLTEGATNLYYTDSRARSVAQAEIGGLTSDNIPEGVANLYYKDSRVSDVFDIKLADASTDDLQEGTHLYYTDVRVQNYIETITTDTLTEGVTNLYYTDQRVQDRISAAHLNDLTDVHVQAPQDGEVLKWNDVGSFWEPQPDIHHTDTDDLPEGQNNLYYTDDRVATRLSQLSIDQLSDVDTTSQAPTVHQSLLWDATNWVPTDIVNSVAGRTGAVTLTTADVAEDTNAHLYFTIQRADDRVQAAIDDTAGDTDTTKLWSADKIHDELNNVVAGQPVVLDDLDDVDTTTTLPISHDFLKWDVPNSMWVPGDIDAEADARIALAVIDDLSNVDTVTNPASVHSFLKWDGTNWIPSTIDAEADSRIAAASIDDLVDVDTSTEAPTPNQNLSWDGTNWVPVTATTVVNENSLSDYTPILETNRDGYFEYIINQNSTITNPFNAIQGQKGMIVVRQDSTGGWAVSWGADYIFPGGTIPTINTDPNAWNIFRYTILASDKVLMEFVADFN
jgi:hypothetical protein